MHVQIAAPGYAGAVATLFDQYRQFYGQPSDPAAAAAFIGARLENGDSHILVALDGDTALGFVQLYPSFTSVGMQRAWILNDLFVAATARRRGVAVRLLDAARDHARASGAARLSLATQKTNAAAKALYASRGWVRDETFDYYSLAV